MAKAHNRTTYNQGSRCDVCVQANSDYRKQRRMQKNGEVAERKPKRLAVVKNVQPDAHTKVHIPGEPTPDPPEPAEWSVEAEVRAQLAELSATTTRRGEVAAAITMARLLDNPRAIAQHPAATGRLVEIIERLRKGSDRKTGKLAAVRKMTRGTDGAPNVDGHGQAQ